MKKHLLVPLLLAAACIFGFTWSRSTGHAETAQAAWSHLQALHFSDHFVGFFDTKSGKLYVYNGRFEPHAICQLEELGKPLTVLKLSR